MSNLVYLNGKFLPQEKAKISCLDTGFIYGFGLFETMRAYNGKVFCLLEHIDRLKKSSVRLNLFALSKKYLSTRIKKTLEINRLSDAYIRLNVWQGKKRLNISIFVKRFDMYQPLMYKKGLKAVVSKFRVNEYSALSGLKTMNYLHFFMARLQAEKKNADEAILLNTKGEVAEGSRANIFLVKDKTLYTPSLDSGCIPGITREIVLNLAQKRRVRVIGGRVKVKDLFRAQEVFITNSLMGIMPVVKINSLPIRDAKPGKMTEMLFCEYRKLTG